MARQIRQSVDRRVGFGQVVLATACKQCLHQSGGGLRTLFARAHGDDTGYRDCRDRYPDMANSLGFEGHIAWAEAMT